MFSRMLEMATLLSSARPLAAPRDRASRNSAPLPANTSSTLAPFDVRREPVEQGFTDTVRVRAQAFYMGEVELAAAPFPANDA
jgi:hypothetical protein